MSRTSYLLLFFSCLATFSIAIGQDRAPHGLAFENPMAFSPSAFEFFHAQPGNLETKVIPCSESTCSPLPMAAKVEGAADQAQESKIASMTHDSGSRIGAGGIAGIVFGLALAVFLVLGAYYVVWTRRANMNRANSVQPDA